VSTAANLPPRAKRLSLRIADLGVPIPPRVQQFLDGPEVEALDGARAWGLEGWDSDSKLKLRWVSGRLADILDHASELDPDAKSKYLPLAALGSEAHMFCVDVTDPALPVFFFDHEAGFKKWADDFDSFTRKLLKRGEKSPTEKLDKAIEAATALNEQKNYPAVIEVLAPVVARFPKSLTYNDDGRDELGTAYNLMGIAYEKAKDIAKASEHYEVALELGNDSAGLNLCDLLLDVHKDYEKLVQFGEKRRDSIWRMGSDNYAWFHVRNYLGQGYLLTGRPRDALRAYHQISELAIEDPPKIREAVDDLKKLRDERPEADRETIDTILGWLDVPPPSLPPGKLEQLRAWWPGLHDSIKAGIKEKIPFDGEPTDIELTRIARLTELEVEGAELTDLSWITVLDRLDDVDLEDNEISDLTPLGKLPLLTTLDVSKNKITSLAPLAHALRLERLVIDDNPLTGLEGLENLHTLKDLHVTSAGLTSLAPLRGLRGLEEITIYENQIEDLSPLADCPRLKEISSFTNPLKRGFAALGKLPWLESVDAGDESDAADLKALRAANQLVSIDSWYPDDDADSVDVEPAPDPTLRAWWTALPNPWKKAFEHEVGKKEPDDAALLSLVREDHIDLEDKPLPDLEPLRRFEIVDWLNLDNTGTNNLAPLSRLPRLRDLHASDNKLDLVSLAPAEKLEELFVHRCQLTSLIGLERCRGLRELYAEDNFIDDLRPLTELTELRHLDLDGNRVTDLAVLAQLRKLHTLKLALTRITDLAPLASCTALRELHVWGVPPLRNALVLAELPELTTVISHGSIPKADVDELRRRNPGLAID
jgi:internalin A